MKHSSVHTNNIASCGTTTEEAIKNRKADAQKLVDTYLTRNTEGIIDLAAPCDKEAKQSADLVACKAADALEGAIRLRRRNVNKTLAEYYQQFEPWLDMSKNPRSGAASEKAMYAPISAFLCCVAHLIQTNPGSGKRPASSTPCTSYLSRLLIPSERVDTTCGDADDKTRIDIGIMPRDVSEAVQTNRQQLSKGDNGKQEDGLDCRQVWYRELFAVIEVKRLSTAAEFTNAYVQLFMYTRNLYVTQQNRRFAWGLAICGTMVEACVFGPNYAVASKSMDISTAEGRRDFVRLLAYWSFSEDHRLGYDPTMRRLKELSCWEIEIPACSDNSEDGAAETGVETQMPPTNVFYSNLMVTVSERLFGRHTRCFLATPDKPLPGQKLTADDYSVFVKDAWPEADEDSSKDARDEIRHLAKIKRILGEKRPDLEGTYPTIKAGGRVLIGCSAGGGNVVQDTTRFILGNILEQSKAAEKRALETIVEDSEADDAQTKRIVHVRVHKRIATTPIGQPISKVKSVFELLVIIADVMKCHSAIYNECSILHRDISINNILFRRTPNGVAGLLIDFDHSKDEELDDGTTHDMRTGTLPFMSINNLENNTTKRTVLDDWESLIYILCWIGTYGYNSKTARKTMSSKPLKIRQWVTDNMQVNADNKRNALNSSEYFLQFVNEFNRDIPGCELLDEAVHLLRDRLVNSTIPGVAQGTIITRPIESYLYSLPGLNNNLNPLALAASPFTTPTKRSSSTSHSTSNRPKPKFNPSPIPSMLPRGRLAGIGLAADSNATDPIALRVQHASEISESLLMILEHGAAKARELSGCENVE